MVTHSCRVSSTEEHTSNGPKFIKSCKTKYRCKNCGSIFEPGNKIENVEINPQSWSCPMCGISDWDNKLHAVKKENIAFQKVESFIYEQQGRLLGITDDSRRRDILSEDLKPFLKKWRLR
jgi:rubredoxin